MSPNIFDYVTRYGIISMNDHENLVSSLSTSFYQQISLHPLPLHALGKIKADLNSISVYIYDRFDREKIILIFAILFEK